MRWWSVDVSRTADGCGQRYRTLRGCRRSPRRSLPPRRYRHVTASPVFAIGARAGARRTARRGRTRVRARRQQVAAPPTLPTLLLLLLLLLVARYTPGGAAPWHVDLLRPRCLEPQQLPLALLSWRARSPAGWSRRRSRPTMRRTSWSDPLPSGTRARAKAMRHRTNTRRACAYSLNSIRFVASRGVHHRGRRRSLSWHCCCCCFSIVLVGCCCCFYCSRHHHRHRHCFSQCHLSLSPSAPSLPSSSPSSSSSFARSLSATPHVSLLHRLRSSHDLAILSPVRPIGRSPTPPVGAAAGGAGGGLLVVLQPHAAPVGSSIRQRVPLVPPRRPAALGGAPDDSLRALHLSPVLRPFVVCAPSRSCEHA